MGVLVIGGIFVALWVEYGPRTFGDDDEPAASLLADADAVVEVQEGSRTQRASITCHGEHRSASGFWASAVPDACDALASTRDALVSGPGCPRIGPDQVGIVVTGSFGTRRFTHRAVRDGCPDPQRWLEVNALALPVLGEDQELEASP